MSEKGLPKSPLLNAQPPQAQSTINLNKLEKVRFTDIRSTAKPSNETSSLRIIIYVIVVIVIGVGAALLVRQMMNQNTTTSDANSLSTDTKTPTSFVTAYSVSTAILEDSTANNLASNSDFKQSSLLTLGSSSIDMSKATLDSIAYKTYRTFSRVSFVLSTSENKFPKTNLTLDSTKNSLTVEIIGLSNINTDLQMDKTISGLVSEIRYDSVNKKYIIFFAVSSGFRVFAVDDTLNIDIRTEDEIAKLNESSSTSTDTSTNTTTNSNTNNTNTSSTSGEAPAAPHYTNTFSQSTQYVSSKVTGKSISLDNYYVWDEGSFFEFSWAEEGSKGDSYVPNAKAYLKEESNIPYVYVEIQNLTRANLTSGLTAQEVTTKTGLNTSNANFVKLTLVSFDEASGKATYKIQLKNKANFQLLTQLNYGNTTQILSIQIKDL